MKKRMENELGHSVTQAEVFDRTHKRSIGEFVDKKSKSVSERYDITMTEKYGDISSQPQFDADIWRQIVGGVGHRHLYGFGREDPRDIVGITRRSRPSSSTSATSRCPLQSEYVYQICSQVLQRLDGILVPHLKDALKDKGIQILNPPTSEVSPTADGDDVQNDENELNGDADYDT